MLVRRAFFLWQFAAAFVLPLWLLVGWAIWGSGAGELLAVGLAAPILGAVLLVVASLTLARKSVRSTRAVSWLDVALFTLWHAAIVGVGLFAAASDWLAVLTIVLSFAALASAAWQLVTETRARFARVFEAFDRQAAQQPTSSAPIEAGEYIVIDQRRPPR